jgi:hypothetical protein
MADEKLSSNEIAVFRAGVSAVVFVGVVIVFAMLVSDYNQRQFDIEAIKAGYEQRVEDGRVLWTKPEVPEAELSPGDL